MLHQFVDAGSASGDDRQTASHRLDDPHGKRFIPLHGVEKSVMLAVDRRQITVLIRYREKFDRQLMLDRKGAHLRDIFRFAAAINGQRHLRSAGANFTDRFQCGHDAAFLIQR